MFWLSVWCSNLTSGKEENIVMLEQLHGVSAVSCSASAVDTLDSDCDRSRAWRCESSSGFVGGLAAASFT